MIQQFRTLTPLNLFYLFAFSVLMSIGALFQTSEDLRPALFEPAITQLSGFSVQQSVAPAINVITAFLITLAQGLLLNRIVNKYNLLGRATFLPALMYIALACSLSSFLSVTPTLLCNFLLLIMIDKFLNIYHKADAKAALFDLGFIAALGTLFYFPFIAFLPTLWVALLIFKPFNWREWLTGLLGFSAPYTLLFLLYFWLDRTAEFTSIWQGFPRQFPHVLKQDFHDYLAWIIPLFILVLFAVSLKKNFYKSTVHIRKSFELLFTLLAVSLASAYLASPFQQYHFILCVPPVAILMAYYFNSAQRRWVFESLFAFMILGFLYFQWF